MSLEVARELAGVRDTIGAWRRQRLRVALVPTMGALHAGHLALLERARTLADRTITSIFVNPTQFAPTDDLARYPRDEGGDLAKLAGAGCNLAWLPDRVTMYPAGAQTWVEVEGLSQGLCGASRLGFFKGVATVVTKLFCQVLPDVAVFGEKDYQQLKVVERLVLDLGLPVEIVGHPTVREADGLAMSSRNAYLDAAQRRQAAALYATLRRTAERLHDDPAGAIATGITALADAGFSPIDYLELRDAATLAPLDRPDGSPARLLAAGWLGSTRLIDNIPVAG